MLKYSTSMLKRVGLFNNLQRRKISTLGAVNYLHPQVLLLFCDPIEEHAAKRENTIWGKLASLKKTDSLSKRELVHHAVSHILLKEAERLSPWEIDRCNLIKEYLKECYQKKILPKYSTYADNGLRNVAFPTCIIEALEKAPVASEVPSCKAI